MDVLLVRSLLRGLIKVDKNAVYNVTLMHIPRAWLKHGVPGCVEGVLSNWITLVHNDVLNIRSARVDCSGRDQQVLPMERLEWANL